MTAINKLKRFICLAALVLAGVGVMPASAGASSVVVSGTVNGKCTVSAVPSFSVTGVPKDTNPEPSGLTDDSHQHHKRHMQ